MARSEDAEPNCPDRRSATTTPHALPIAPVRGTKQGAATRVQRRRCHAMHRWREPVALRATRPTSRRHRVSARSSLRSCGLRYGRALVRIGAVAIHAFLERRGTDTRDGIDESLAFVAQRYIRVDQTLDHVGHLFGLE